jgi:carbonic anhydrase/acetyltransferase-like protein (isoleucine patch superfamily)
MRILQREREAAIGERRPASKSSHSARRALQARFAGPNAPVFLICIAAQRCIIKELAGAETPGRKAGMIPSLHAIRDYYVASTAVVTGNVVLSAGANVWFGTVIRGDLARITLGARANLQDGCIVHTDTDAPQTIEDGVVVGHRAILHGTRIGTGSLIGMGAIVLSGCEVGEECLIAAGTIITEGRRIPPRSVVMGVPGKVVREIRAEEIARTREICAHYFEMAQRYARGDFPPPWAGQ